VVIIKNQKQIEGIRQSCRLAARTLTYLANFIRPGLSTQVLDDLASRFIVQHQATAAPLNYGAYPKSICTSVNDVVCHGIPSKTVILKISDIINIDITTVLNGFYGDISATYPVGLIGRHAQLLIDRTRKARDLAIKHLKPGKKLNDCIGRVIEPFVTQFAYSVVHDLGGHGVGLQFHEDPFVFHFDTSRSDTILQPGMIFTVEPMINASPNWQVNIDPVDGWTVRTADGSLSCQFEHTVLITPNGHEILTQI